MDKSSHDLLKSYAEITQQLRGKTRHPRRSELAAARSAAANFSRRLCRVFPRKFGLTFNEIVQVFVHPAFYGEAPGSLRFLVKSSLSREVQLFSSLKIAVLCVSFVGVVVVRLFDLLGGVSLRLLPAPSSPAGLPRFRCFVRFVFLCGKGRAVGTPWLVTAATKCGWG